MTQKGFSYPLLAQCMHDKRRANTRSAFISSTYRSSISLVKYQYKILTEMDSRFKIKAHDSQFEHIIYLLQHPFFWLWNSRKLWILWGRMNQKVERQQKHKLKNCLVSFPVEKGIFFWCYSSYYATEIEIVEFVLKTKSVVNR